MSMLDEMIFCINKSFEIKRSRPQSSLIGWISQKERDQESRAIYKLPVTSQLWMIVGKKSSEVIKVILNPRH